MGRPSIWVVAVLAGAFLLSEAPGIRALSDGGTNRPKDATLLWGARAETTGGTGTETLDCVLPGKIRPLGSSTYLSPGRTIRTTKPDCEAQGGWPVAPSGPGTEMPSGEPAERDAPVSPESGARSLLRARAATVHDARAEGWTAERIASGSFSQPSAKAHAH